MLLMSTDISIMQHQPEEGRMAAGVYEGQLEEKRNRDRKEL